MSYGFQFKNTSGVFSVTENTKAYVYLGKYGPFGASGVADYDVDVTCVGFPVIFFSVPNNFTVGDGGLSSEPWIRSGVFIKKLVYLGSNVWRVSMGGFNASTTISGTPVSLATTLRVFGRLDLNFPTGATGNTHGLRVWDASGALVFDSNARMLRLAGNTYDTEIRLRKEYPGYATGDPDDDWNSYDTSVPLPFSMAGKSIQATTRGLLNHYQAVGGYYDPGSGLFIYQYVRYQWATGYWASGSTLYARKFFVSSNTVEYDTPVSVYLGGLADVYSRLAVIDDSQFP